MKMVYFICLITIPLVLFGLSGCSSDNATSPNNSKVCAYYSDDYSQQQTQSSKKLSDYMTGEHYDYHVFGWDIEASLIDNNNDTIAFFISIEYNNNEWRAGVGFNKKSNNGFKWSGFTNTNVEINQNPWSIKIVSPDNADKYIILELVSGEMGAANAVYRFKADILDLDGKPLKTDLQLSDAFGSINQGFGTTSFYPQYLTDEQRTYIMNLPEKTIDAYLFATGDMMTCQGDYYYAIPLMDVSQFTIEYDGNTFSGNKGKSWMDYFVQTYSQESYQITKGSTWEWLAIQLPDINTAINILKITTSTGTIAYARLFNSESDETNNGARKANFSWELDKITIEPSGSNYWTSPTTGKKYALQYNIQLQSSTLNGNLTINMAFENQEVILPEGAEYQGLGLVEGTIGGQAVYGRCWVEVQPTQ